MASQRNVFTYQPARNKILYGKRFSRRTTTVRPITFFKNWDSNLNTPESCKKQKSPPKDSLFVPETQNEANDELCTGVEANENNDILHETSHMDILDRDKSTRSATLAHRAKHYNMPIRDTSSGMNKNEVTTPANTTDHQDSLNQNTESSAELSDDSGRKLTDDDNTNYKGNEKVVEESGNNAENLSEINNRNSDQGDRYSAEGEDSASDKQSGHSSTQAAIVSYLQSAGLHVSLFSDGQVGGNSGSGRGKEQAQIAKRGNSSGDSDGCYTEITGGKREQGEHSRKPERESVYDRGHKKANCEKVGKNEPSKKGSRVADIDKDHDKATSLQMVEKLSCDTDKGHKKASDRQFGQGEPSRRDDDPDKGHDKVSHGEMDIREEIIMETEEIDITHKIPLAQSTAIGVEIEQEVEEEDEVINSSQNTLHKHGGHVNEGLSGTPQRSTKRKLVTSTPKVDPNTKRKRISIATPVSVQSINIQVPQEKQESKRHSAKEVKPKAGKTRKHSRESVRNQPAMEETPDLRKAMLLSYAKTPSGTTPSYLVKTPKSGPVIRPPKKKARPVIVPVPEDLALSSPQRVEEVVLWQGEVEHKRRLSDTTDLDIILQTFERVAWHYKENIEEPSIRKAVTLFAKKTQADLRNMVSRCQQLKDMKSSYAKSQSIINKKRVQLLNLHQEHSRLQASVASVRLELQAIETKAEHQTDVLKFKQVMNSVRKEQQSQRNKKGKAKMISAVITKDNSGLSGNCLNQAHKILSGTVQSLKHKT